MSRISTPFKVNVIIAAIFVLSFTLGSFPLWTVGIGYDPSLCRQTCTVLDLAYYTWWDVWVRYLSLFAASAIIFVLVGLILFFLRRAFVRRRMFMEGQRDCKSSDTGGRVRTEWINFYFYFITGYSVEKNKSLLFVWT